MVQCTFRGKLACILVLVLSSASNAAEKDATASSKKAKDGSELVRLETEQSRIADELLSVEATLGAIERKVYGARLQVGLDSETSE
ncbi:MAG: hypothetical protein D6806_10805, partial [Deltaproteobacteria bacterium]